MNVEIDKEVLFELLNSHSTMSRKEYNNNGDYNSDHYSFKAEEKIIKVLTKHSILNEYFDYSEKNILEY